MLRIASIAVPIAVFTSIYISVSTRELRSFNFYEYGRGGGGSASPLLRQKVPSSTRPEVGYSETIKDPRSHARRGGRGDVTRSRHNTESNLSAPKPLHDPNLRIIRNADVTLKVTNFQSKWNQVALIARSAGGFIGESNADKADDGSLSGSITVRIPEKLFESALERISKLGTLENKKVSSEDVSQEYTDTDSRIRNFKSQEARLLSLMNRARKLDDVLRLESELNRVRGEIEQATGRIKWLSSVTTYSTINVSMHEKSKKKPVPPAGWTFKREVKNAWLALLDALKVAATVLVWTVIYVPFYMVIVALAFVGYRRATRVWKTA